MKMAQDLNLQEVLGRSCVTWFWEDRSHSWAQVLHQVETNQTVDMSAFPLEDERPPGPDLWMALPLNLTLANLSHPDLKIGLIGGVLQKPPTSCLLRLRLRGRTCLHASYSY